MLQVIYSLNMKNEEQEAALQALSNAHHDELHRILMETCHEGEGSALRTRLLELQESLDEQQRVGAQVRACVSPCLWGWGSGSLLWLCNLMSNLPVRAANQTWP